jgi:hypothetical protein
VAATVMARARPSFLHVHAHSARIKGRVHRYKFVCGRLGLDVHLLQPLIAWAWRGGTCGGRERG